MQHSILFAYRPPVKPRPIRRGVFGDVVYLTAKGNIEPVIFLDIASLSQTSSQTVDLVVINDAGGFVLPIFAAIESVVDNDGAALVIPAYTDDIVYTDVGALLPASVSATDTLSFTDSNVTIAGYTYTETATVTDVLSLSAIAVTDGYTISDAGQFTPPPKAGLDTVIPSDVVTLRALVYVESVVQNDSDSIAGYKNIEGFFMHDAQTWIKP